MRPYMLLAALALAGCQQGFDEKYAETERQLKADAQRIDAEMARQERAPASPPADPRKGNE